MQLFRFYATASDDKPVKGANTSQTLNASYMSGGRSEFNPTKSQLSNRLANAIGYVKHMFTKYCVDWTTAGCSLQPTWSISYPEYLRFAQDFGLNVNLGLTTIDIGDVYLSTITVGSTIYGLNLSSARTVAQMWSTCSQSAEPITFVRKFNFADFWYAYHVTHKGSCTAQTHSTWLGPQGMPCPAGDCSAKRSCRSCAIKTQRRPALHVAPHSGNIYFRACGYLI